MKNQNSFKLIDGKYIADDAMEILMNLFNSKIYFHELKNFSLKERSGTEDKFSKKRIKELTKCTKDIAALINKAEKKNKKVVIRSFVDLTFE